MGYVINLGFCEVCGKQIFRGERFCDEHKNSNIEKNEDDDSEDEKENAV